MKFLLAILGVALCAFDVSAQFPPILRNQFTTNTSTAVISSLTADASPDGAADYIITLDASAGAVKKVLLNNLPGSGAGEANVGANLGIGYPISAPKTGVTLNFNTFTNNPTYLTVTSNANTFTWTFANSIVTNMALLNGVNTWTGIQTFSAIPVVPNNSFTLGTHTVGNYALGDAEGGAATTVVTVDGTDTTSSVAIFDAATGNQAIKTDGGLNYNAGTGLLSATGFAGDGSGLTNLGAANVAGTVANATNAATVTIVDGTDTTSHVLISDSPVGNLPVKTDAGLGYNAGIGQLTAVSYLGSGAGLTVDATAFSGNLSTSDTNLQLVANALDALNIAAGAGAPLNGTNHWTGTNTYDIPIIAAGIISTNGLQIVGLGPGTVAFEGATVNAFSNVLSTVDPTGNGLFLLPDVPGTNILALTSQLSTSVTNYWPVVNAGVGYGLDTNSVDNTAAIQAAINNATNDIGFAGATFGKRVFIPAGLYNVDGAINLYPGISLEGEAAPRSTGTRLYKNTSGPLLIVHAPSTVAIRNLSLASDAIATGAIGIVSSTNGTAMADLLIENVYLRLFSTAVWLTNASDVRIRGGGATINGVGYRLGPGDHHIVLDGVAIAGGSGATDGVLINGSTTTGIDILNSSFRTTLTYGIRATNNSVGGVGGLRMSFNEFESVTYPIYLNGTSEVINSALALGNTFRSAGTNIYANFVTGLTTMANRSTGNQPMIVIASTVRGLNMYGDDWPSTATPIVGTPSWGIFAFSNIVVSGTGTYVTAPNLYTPSLVYDPTTYNGSTNVMTRDDFRDAFHGRTNVFEFALSDESTALTTGVAKLTWRAPYAITLVEVRASVSTNSTSGIPTVDINEAGATILSTKLTIDANEETSTTAAAAAVISDASIADDAEVTFDIDVAGTAASGLKVKLYTTRQ